MLTFENATTLPSGGSWTGDGESAAAGHSSHNRSSSTSPCFFQFCCLLVCLLREAAVHGKVVVPRGMRLKNQLAHSPTLAHTRSRARARAHTHTHTHNYPEDSSASTSRHFGRGGHQRTRKAGVPTTCTCHSPLPIHPPHNYVASSCVARGMMRPDDAALFLLLLRSSRPSCSSPAPLLWAYSAWRRCSRACANCDGLVCHGLSTGARLSWLCSPFFGYNLAQGLGLASNTLHMLWHCIYLGILPPRTHTHSRRRTRLAFHADRLIVLRVGINHLSLMFCTFICPDSSK